ncbi:hypothetical protein BHYA_0335g00080 [Botrytis hyacinthi]|uniref:Uncharacterized protein n=1 Tax=Botrytis hyacinthi TaxID=278943 RepID=A0A4Z1GDB2_9HELO|nr:hypothetical protein BHYA_0335g00080 [Botrytis hyacinthi]
MPESLLHQAGKDRTSSGLDPPLFWVVEKVVFAEDRRDDVILQRTSLCGQQLQRDNSSKKVASVKVDQVHTEDVGVDKINDEEVDAVKTNAGDFGVNVVNTCDVDGKASVTEYV